MDSYPPQSPNDPAAAYAAPVTPLPYYGTPVAGNRRPTSVTVLAVIGIILGSLILLGTLCNTLQIGGGFNADNPVVKVMRDDTVLFAWSIISLFVSLALGALLLGGSINSLKLKPSGRSWMIGYSWLDIAFTAIGAAVNVALVMPKLGQAVQNAGLKPEVKMAVQISSWGGLAFSILMLAYPALILFYMSRPHVKAAFGRASGQA